MAPSRRLPPHTPPQCSPTRLTPPLGDSPFSDYFTDEPANSPSLNHRDFRNHSRQRPLLERLNSIGAQLARADEDGKIANAVNDRLDALEAVLAAPETRSRLPVEMEDSGLFMIYDESENSYAQDRRPSQPNFMPNDDSVDRAHDSLSEEDENDDEKDSLGDEIHNNIDIHETPFDLDSMLQTGNILGINGNILNKNELDFNKVGQEAQTEISVEESDKISTNPELGDLLSRLSAAQQSLKQRYSEVKNINEMFSEKLFQSTAQISTLKSTNISLVHDLQLTGLELDFLKLQLHKIEQQIPESGSAGDEMDAEALQNAVERWKVEWNETKQRFNDRQAVHEHKVEAPPRDSPWHDSVFHIQDTNVNGRIRTTRFELGARAATAPLLHTMAVGENGGIPPRNLPISSQGEEVLSSSHAPQSAWSAFWDSLAEAAGVLDYHRLLYEEE